MADDKATSESIDSLVSMFGDIDRDTVRDIFLGCKKDVDRTVDQLLCMGAVIDNAAKNQTPAPAPVTNTPPASPVLTAPAPAPAPAPLDKAPTSPVIAPHVIDSTSERDRLELLNQQLSQEYKRLAETQERNLILEKQLAATQANIASEYQVLAEERRRLEEQQAAFQADKKRLEEHLSGRLREMKEEMRKKEEQAREAEDARRLAMENHFEEERKKFEETKAERDDRREEQACVEKKLAEMIARHKAMKEESNLLQAVIAQMDEEKMDLKQTVVRLQEEAAIREETWRAENEALSKNVADLEQSSAGNVHSAQESVVGALQTVSLWLSKGLEDFQNKNVTPAELKHELLKSLQNTTL